MLAVNRHEKRAGLPRSHPIAILGEQHSSIGAIFNKAPINSTRLELQI